MKKPFIAFVAFLALLLGASPVFANPVVTSPTNNEEVNSPFSLVASATTCDAQKIVSMGYSLDYGQTTIVHEPSISALVIAGVGAHTLHVKSWGSKGAECSTPVAIDVTASLIIPANATAVSNIQQMSTWEQNHDPATSGSSSGTTDLVATPSLSGQARQFSLSFSSAGGEIYHVTIGHDTVATHFIYDAYVYFPSTAGVANLEMDMNQVLANGQTVIYGFQCDGYSSTWDYTKNSGTPTAPHDSWVHSAIPCNPREWATDTWHHVQIAYERDAVGNVTYETVVFDGVQSELNATVNSAHALGWTIGTLLTNFQIDGEGTSGSVVVYLDNATVYRW